MHDPRGPAHGKPGLTALPATTLCQLAIRFSREPISASAAASRIIASKVGVAVPAHESPDLLILQHLADMSRVGSRVDDLDRQCPCFYPPPPPPPLPPPPLPTFHCEHGASRVVRESRSSTTVLLLLQVQASLGAKRALAFDITAACSGFVIAMNTAAQFIRTGTYKTVVVIGADCLSRYVDWRDRCESPSSPLLLHRSLQCCASSRTAMTCA